MTGDPYRSINASPPALAHLMPGCSTQFISLFSKGDRGIQTGLSLMKAFSLQDKL
jgi:hypothetical protein